MHAVPRLHGPDHTLPWLADPYRYIGRQCRRLQSDVVEARLMLEPALLLTGAAAAEIFYDGTRFRRQGAAPEPLRATLFGEGTVQGLDGERHRHRKALFLSLVEPAAVQRLADETQAEWHDAAARWQRVGGVSLYRAVQPLLTRAVCRWAGVPMSDEELPLRTQQLVALFDAAGSGLLGHVGARRARRGAETWLAARIDLARAGRGALLDGSAAMQVALAREPDGTLLPMRVAAAELLNLLRPTVAVSVAIAHVAHALHLHPQARERLADDVVEDDGDGDAPAPPRADAFVQEVRRHYPFFPAVAARVRVGFEWQGAYLPTGTRALLDLYGTNHDRRAWTEPQRFDPERFAKLDPQTSPFAFVPQGGGDPATGHRCPGEGIATTLMRQALDMLTKRMRYTVPPQDLHLDFGRLPAVPPDGLRIANIRLAG